MKRSARHLGESATAWLKLAAVAVVLATVVSTGRTAIAPLLVDRPLDRTAQEQRATLVAYRHATSYDAQPEAEQQDPF